MIHLTPRAIIKIQEFEKKESSDEPLFFRVSIEKKDCEGLKFVFSLDCERQGDKLVDISGIKVLVDPMVTQHIQGWTVDYEADGQGEGFCVIPNNQPV